MRVCVCACVCACVCVLECAWRVWVRARARVCACAYVWAVRGQCASPQSCLAVCDPLWTAAHQPPPQGTLVQIPAAPWSLLQTMHPIVYLSFSRGLIFRISKLGALWRSSSGPPPWSGLLPHQRLPAFPVAKRGIYQAALKKPLQPEGLLVSLRFLPIAALRAAGRDVLEAFQHPARFCWKGLNLSS